MCPLFAKRVRPTITPRVVSPVRCEQAGERGNEDHTFRARDRPCERLDLRCVADDPEVVTQPLDERARHRDRALERIDRIRVTELPRDCGDEAVFRHHRLRSEGEEQEGARAVRALHVTVVEAGVTKQRGRLVPEDSRDRHAGQLADGAAVHLTRRADLRKKRRGMRMRSSRS